MLRRVLLASTMAAMAAFSFAQTQWQTALYYDLRDRSVSAVATTRITTFTNVLGKGVSLDLDAFAGATLDVGRPVAGVSLGKRFALADQAVGYIGLGLRAANGRPVGFGPTIGVSVRLP